MSSEPFTLVYDGPALRKGKMDAQDLAYALLAVGETVSRANHLLNGQDATVKLRISAAKNPGSFPAILELFQDLQQQGLIGGEVVPPQVILEHLGLVTASVLSDTGTIRNLIDLWKLLRGKEPKVTDSDLETNTATVEVDGNNNRVDQTTLNLYGDVIIHKHFPRVFTPLRGGEVDSLEALHRGRIVRKVTAEDAKAIVSGDWHDREKPGERLDEIRAEIITPQFRPDKYKWRFFNDYLGVFTADMLDKEFVSEILEKGGGFNYGDTLHFEMRTKISETDEGRTVEREITKVFHRTSAPRQTELSG